jgi:hypothetical protein
VGGAISRKISADESMGLTIYYTARSFSKTVSDRSFPSTTKSQMYTQEKSIVENGIIPILGYRKKVSDQFSWGATIRFPAIKIKGTASLFESLTDVDSSAPSPIQSTVTSVPEKPARVVVPGKMTVGIAYQYSPDLLVAFDVSAREARSYSDLEDEQYASRIRHKSVLNAQLGFEQIFVDWFKVRMGFYTNFSSHPNPDESIQKLQEDHVDMLGYSANFVFVADKQISYTFGGYYTGGWGRSVQRIDQQYKEIPKTAHVFTMLVGTSFYF